MNEGITGGKIVKYMIASKRSIARAQAAKKVKPKRKVYVPEKQYTSFNIFTKGGENLVVTSKKPMTLTEAQYHFGALSISGND